MIGAGPAGLAAAACLRAAGVSSVVFERESAVGSSWRRHYDRLHLHTDKRHSGLPGLAFPATSPRYPSRDEVVAYLEAYARHFDLDLRFGLQVVSAERKGDRWRVLTRAASPGAEDQVEHSAPYLVVASGYTRVPVVPTWPGSAEFAGELLHSSAYASGERFRGKRVLVVGAGNSGAEIALDLFEQGAEPTLAVRSPVTVIHRDPLGLPFLTLAIPLDRLPPRLADALTKPLLRVLLGPPAGFGLPSDGTGPFTRVARDGRIPLIDVGTLALLRSGRLPVRGAVAGFEGEHVVFADGAREPFAAVVLATGYRPGIEEFLRFPVGDGAGPTSFAHHADEGLYLCGFYLSPTGMLRRIAAEARAMSADVARRVTPAGRLARLPVRP